jgi:ABC-2 type transport system ATP-binding protein
MTQISVLITKELSIHINGEVLLDKIDICLASQQSLAVLGVNGAGKSTLLKTIMGLYPSYQGQCLLCGYPPTNPLSRKGVVFLAERPELPSQLTGQEYLELQMQLHHAKISPELLQFYLEVLGLLRVDLKQPVRNYSKGMLQKLMLLGMFLPQPRLMVLDEVMSGLDMLARPKVRQLLQSYRQQGGTVLFTTHLLEDVTAFASHVFVLYQGKRHFYRPAELFKEKDIKEMIQNQYSLSNSPL